MKMNPVRYSSAVGQIWVMATFKIKYCHNIFDMQIVRELTDALFHEAFQYYNIVCDKLSFDANHVHMIIDMGLYGKSEIAKKLRGYVAKKLFHYLPWLKQNKFWGSGLWNPAYDMRSVNDICFYRRYLDKQKYASNGQTVLTGY